MKYINIYNRLFMLLVIAGLVISCNDKDENLKGFQVTEGALIVPDATSGAFLFGVTTETSFGFTISTNEGFGISSVTVYKQLVSALGSSEEVTAGSYSSFPATFSATTNELFADVPVDGAVLIEGDLSPGDQWVFRYELNMADGRTLSDVGSKNYTLTFTCPSDLAGTYTTLTDGGTGDGSGGTAGTFTGLAHEVTLVETTEGVYTISDITGGLYEVGYGDADNPATIGEVCGVISLVDQPDVVYGGDVFNGSGVVNADGTITISWLNNFGDNGVTTLTLQ